jgi:hypothetical protein
VVNPGEIKLGGYTMITSVKTYKDCIVTREETISCGADWEDRMAAGLSAGTKCQKVSVIRKRINPDFDEVLLTNDPLFTKAVEATK